MLKTSLERSRLPAGRGRRAANDPVPSGKDEERETPPAEPLIVGLLSKPQEEGLSTLVLLDEALMYLRAQVETDQSARGRMVAFFQYLTQAVVKVDRCAMVASLLASDPGKHDELGNEILRQVSEVFGRQTEEDASPVSKEDVSEVLRRRFFKPESIHEQDTFRPHVTSVVANVAALDDRRRRSGRRPRTIPQELSRFTLIVTEIFYTPLDPDAVDFSGRAASCAPLRSRCATRRSGIPTPW